MEQNEISLSRKLDEFLDLFWIVLKEVKDIEKRIIYVEKRIACLKEVK